MKKRVKREIPKNNWDKYYRGYQRALAERFLIPTLLGWQVPFENRSFLEVGCGDGGCAAAFHRAGCRVIMMDIEERLVALARTSNETEGVDAKVFVGDVFDDQAEFYQEGPFDIVMFRDVMEHLADPVKALEITRRHLNPRGAVFVVFPPYYSPFGAHQQILPKKKIGFLPYNKLPYIQLLPERWFLSIIRGESSANKEVERLRSIRLTIGKFERSAERAGFRIRHRKLYLSRPSFALRYGLPVVGASVIAGIPGLREVAVTAAYYLLEPVTGGL